MKQLIFKIVIPLTVISFALFTQWRCAAVVDAPDTMFWGFPLPYTCPGLHTSLSYQIFVIEFIIDLLTYFLFWFTVVFCFNRFVHEIKIHKTVTKSLWILSILLFIYSSWIFFVFIDNHIFYIKRPFDIETIKTSFQFIWQNNLQCY